MKIPKQLQNPEFKFYLIGKGSKLAIEKDWNGKNNYEFFDPKLINHLNSWGNYGIVTGIGKLVVIDFDAKQVQDKFEPLLPKTFTVKTASKGLHHKYYYLKGEMIGKEGVDMLYNPLNNRYYTITPVFKDICPSGLVKKRVLDLQADRCGIVAPGSMVERKYYEVVDESDIAEIDLDTLKTVLKLSTVTTISEKKSKSYKQITNVESNYDETLVVLNNLKIERTGPKHFKCPFHEMDGKGNMVLYPNGSLFCFHCRRSFGDMRYFIHAVLKERGEKITKQKIDEVMKNGIYNK